MNSKINNIMLGITCIVILVTATVFISLFKNTYSISDKYVVFKGVGDHNGEILKSCKIGSDGKLDASCVAEAGKICGKWSRDNWTEAYNTDGKCQQNQTGQKTTAEMKELTFNDAAVYYCVACSSTSITGNYSWGCYVNDSDPTQMKWVINDDAGSGWHLDSSITDDKLCPPPATPACYECKADSHIMQWKNDDKGDSKCSGGYKKTNKPQSECNTIEPACFECKADSHVMFWKYDDKGDSNCIGGYKKTNKSQSECKSITPACYECKADKNIMKWEYDAVGDNNCPGGYNKTTKVQTECKTVVPENPPTGQTGVFFTWIASVVAILCSLWYLKKSV